MRLTYVPTLAITRDLYRMPRDAERFRTYLRTMLNDAGDDLDLPLVAMNPMARDHALAAVEHLIALDADRVAAQATDEAQERLAAAPGELRVTLVVSDDIGGMWTDRAGTELSMRLGWDAFTPGGALERTSPPSPARNWVTAITWTSNRPDAPAVRALVLAAIYRVAHRAAHGPARTLGALLVQEARAERFAGHAIAPPPPGADEIVDRLWAATDTPTLYAAWSGDDFAELMGYDPVGLGMMDALAVATERKTGDPVAALVPRRSG